MSVSNDRLALSTNLAAESEGYAPLPNRASPILRMGDARVITGFL